MTLKEQFLSFPPTERRRVHFALCEKALAIWEAYTRKTKRIRYADSVVGLSHTVDQALPGDAFKAAQEGRDSEKIKERYAEPIAAMQDDDLKFPDNVKFAYYSIYNLFCKYVSGCGIDDWLIVNQAISSETDQAIWASLLSQAINPGIGSGKLAPEK